MDASQQVVAYQRDSGSANWALAELVEAATRSGMREAAADALRLLAETSAARAHLLFGEWLRRERRRAEAREELRPPARPLASVLRWTATGS